MGRIIRMILALIWIKAKNRGYIMANATPRNFNKVFPTRNDAERAALNDYEKSTIYVIGANGYLYEDDCCTKLAPGRLILQAEGRGSLVYCENRGVVGVPLLGA